MAEGRSAPDKLSLSMAERRSAPDKQKGHRSERKMEYAQRPFVSLPYLKHPDHQHTSLLSPSLHPDYSSIFPVFPLEVDHQPGVDPDGLSTLLFDGINADGIGEESRLSGSQCHPLFAKGTRSKRKIERQKNGGSPRLESIAKSIVRWPSLSMSSSSNGGEIMNRPKFYNNNDMLKFVLQKELKRSDVCSLGRIVLPKKHAEANMPHLAAKEGIKIILRDLISSHVWSMRYRYWPNNRSRMYVLEHTGEFVKQHDLVVGDSVTLYTDEGNKLFIHGRKVKTSPLSPLKRNLNGDGDEGRDEKHTKILMYRSSTQTALEIPQSSSSNSNLTGGCDAFSLAASTLQLWDCDFSHLERLSGFEDCDLSLYYDDREDRDRSVPAEQKKKFDGANTGAWENK